MQKIFYIKNFSFFWLLSLLIISNSNAEIIKTTCKSILNNQLIGERSFVLNTDLKLNEEKLGVLGATKNNDIIKWNYFEYLNRYEGWSLFSYEINQKTGRGFSQLAVLTAEQKENFKKNKLFSKPNYGKYKVDEICN